MTLFARLMTLMVLLCAMAKPASAVCNISATNLSFSPATANAGTYVPPNTPTSLAVAVTVGGQYSSDNQGGPCRIALSFNRVTYPPATMLIQGGGTATLPYTITSANGGGNTLLFTGTGTTIANVLIVTVATTAGTTTNVNFSSTFNVWFRMLPNTPQQAGSYLDVLSAWVFNVNAAGNGGNLLRQFAFTVTGTVARVCTIGGLAQGPTGSATIPVSAAGAVNTGVINRTFSNVACNAPSNVQVSSQNGAVRTATAPPTGFTNQINYSSTASFGGATANLNTATNPTATGQESGTAVSTTGSTPSGSLTVAITPQANAQRLLAGSYGDVLRVTITPQ